jgi:hypothetical protein
VVMARATLGEADGGTSITLGSFGSAKNGTCDVDNSLLSTVIVLTSENNYSEARRVPGLPSEVSRMFNSALRAYVY